MLYTTVWKIKCVTKLEHIMEWDVRMDEAVAASRHYGDGRLALDFGLQTRAASRKINQNSVGGKTKKGVDKAREELKLGFSSLSMNKFKRFIFGLE